MNMVNSPLKEELEAYSPFINFETHSNGNNQTNNNDKSKEEQFFFDGFKWKLPLSSNPAISKDTILSPSKSKKATELNKIQVQKSGIALKELMEALGKKVDLNKIKQILIDQNNQSGSLHYPIQNNHPNEVDSLFTEAIHQFQKANYINPKEHDGVLGRSTIETLGYINHNLKVHLNSSEFYGQQELDKIKQEIEQASKGEFTAKNWFRYIVKPAWLGIKISDGIHLLLLRKLQQAESWLLSQPQYKGLQPAALGKALGFTSETSFSGARLSKNKQAMHGFGLAIDINSWGNPWIGAGWIKHDKELLKERTRFIEALKKASGTLLPGNTIFAYLHSIAENAGNDTQAAYDILQKRNNEFISYLKGHLEELKYWQKSATFGNRNPLHGFLNLHSDLVYALRQVAGLAWGAIDFGPRANGDIMHFDLRTIGIGKIIATHIKGFIPESNHPTINNKFENKEFENSHDFHDHEDLEYVNESEYHEAIEEALMDDDLERIQSSYQDTNSMNEDFFNFPSISTITNFLGVKNLAEAIRLNRYYGEKLGWNNFILQINELLLPYSGVQNVSLGEEAFAQAVTNWQKKQGFSDKDSDGIIGPNTWRLMKSFLNNTIAPPSNSTGGITTGTIEEVEWSTYTNIKSYYNTPQAYKSIRDQVKGWGINTPGIYIDTALYEWQSNPGIHLHFDNNFDQKPNNSYLNLKRLYNAKGINNPASYFSANIVQIKFFNRSTPGHKDLKAALETAQKDLNTSGNNFVLDSAWSFVPRTFNNNINKLSNHALGRAIDINPVNNPHILSSDEIMVIDAVCKTALPSGLLSESDPNTLQNASVHFQNNFNDLWIGQQTQSLLIKAIKRKRARLNGYAQRGFMNLPTKLVKALQNAGLKWGGSWTSAKDFMHFEL